MPRILQYRNLKEVKIDKAKVYCILTKDFKKQKVIKVTQQVTLELKLVNEILGIKLHEHV